MPCAIISVKHMEDIKHGNMEDMKHGKNQD